MPSQGSSRRTGQHLRSLREDRRRLLKQGRPEHFCAQCQSVVFAQEEQCLQCAMERPESGWPDLLQANDPWLGKIIDERYLVARPIGQGASGQVYRAESLSIFRQFAVKIIATDQSQAQAEQIIARLNREIEALSRLRNPHIVSFYEILDLQGKFVAAIMDLIDGSTLEELIATKGPLDLGRACALLRQIANGLFEAHQAGMIHRDLKPENLMVEKLPAGDDFVHILDFGIVRLNDDAGVSMTHGFIGTPLYASPEQAMAKSLDHRSDIYSLGAILFFMLTGEPPFVSNNVYDVLRMHVRTPPRRLGQAAATRLFPEPLERLVARMLAKSPEDRPEDLSAVIEELDHLLAGQFSDAQLQSSATHVGDSISSVEAPSRHTPALGLSAHPSTGDAAAGFGRDEHTSAATIQSYGQRNQRKKTQTPAFLRTPTPLPGGEGRIQAIPGQIRFEGSGNESSAATAIPAASYRLSVASRQVRATHGDSGVFAILEREEPPEAFLFEPESSRPRPLPIATQSGVQSIALSENYLIAGHRNGVISRVELSSGKSRTLFQDVRRRAVTAVAADRRERCIVAGSESGRVYAHQRDRNTSSEWVRIRGGQPVRALAINHSADTITIARQDNSVEVISLSNPRVPTAQFRVDAPIRSMAISPDNYLMAAALVDRSVALIQLPTGRRLLSLQADRAAVLAVHFSDDGTPVAICSINKEIRVLQFEQIGSMVPSS